MGNNIGMNLAKTAPEGHLASDLENAMSSVATALSDPSRVSMLCALMDGRAWTATELSAAVGIAPSTASGHLTRLLRQGLVMCLAQGRHRYYRLAGPEIAGLVENLMGVSMHAYAAPVSRTPEHLRYARTCYDHLAGELAVKIYHYLQEESWLVMAGTALTPFGSAQFQRLGATLSPRARRNACCPCLDWSERRYHLAGDAGAALLTLFMQKGWLTRTPGYREITVSDTGRIALQRLFRLKEV